MIESLIIQYLSEHQNLPVYGEEPEHPPVSYIIVEKLGGGEIERLRQAHIAVQCYAESKAEASKLNSKIIDILSDITILNEVSSISLNSDYDYTDTTTKRYRYQAVFDLVHY